MFKKLIIVFLLVVIGASFVLRAEEEIQALAGNRDSGFDLLIENVDITQTDLIHLEQEKILKELNQESSILDQINEKALIS